MTDESPCSPIPLITPPITICDESNINIKIIKYFQETNSSTISGSVENRVIMFSAKKIYIIVMMTQSTNWKTPISFSSIWAAFFPNSASVLPICEQTACERPYEIT